MAAKRKDNVFSSTYPSGILFVGALVIGVGVGMLKQDVAAYTLLGLGVGFVLAGLATLSSRNRHL
jgi:hypothetical protein